MIKIDYEILICRLRKHKIGLVATELQLTKPYWRKCTEMHARTDSVLFKIFPGLHSRIPMKSRERHDQWFRSERRKGKDKQREDGEDGEGRDYRDSEPLHVKSWTRHCLTHRCLYNLALVNPTKKLILILVAYT
jgi:hypothetical protein